MAKELKGYRVSILSEPGNNSPQNIINEESFPRYQRSMILVTDGRSGDSSTVMDDEPHLVLEKRIVFGEETLSVNPVNIKGANSWKMFGGRFVWSSDSRFRNEVSKLPLPLHERVESFGEGGGINSHNSQAPMQPQEPTVDLTPVEFIPLYNKDEDEYIHARLRYNDHFKHWDASIDGESEYFKNKADAIASIESAGFKRKETFATGGDISSIDSDIEKLEKVVSSSMIPEHVKEKAKSKIAELKAQKESSKEKAAPNSGEKKMTGSKLRGYYYAAMDKLNINSGSEIYQSEEIQRKLHAELSKKIPFMILEPKIFDNLEDNNAHSLNNYLGLRGMYGEAKRQKYVQDYNEQPKHYWNPSSITSTAPVQKTEEPVKPIAEKPNLMDMPELRKVIKFFENNIGKEVNLTITEFDGTSDVSGPIKKNGEYLYAIDWANFDLVLGTGLYGTESSYRNVRENGTSLSFEYSGSKYQVQIASTGEDFSKTEENKETNNLSPIAQMFKKASEALPNGKSKLVVCQLYIAALHDANFHQQAKRFNYAIDKSIKSRADYFKSEYGLPSQEVNDVAISIAQETSWTGEDIKDGFVEFANASGFEDLAKYATQTYADPLKLKGDVIGFAIVDPISGDIVASKATLDGLKEAHSQMEKDPDFADLDGIVYSIVLKNGKNVLGEKIEVDWIKSKKSQEIEKPEGFEIGDTFKTTAKSKGYFEPNKTYEITDNTAGSITYNNVSNYDDHQDDNFFTFNNYVNEGVLQFVSRKDVKASSMKTFTFNTSGKYIERFGSKEIDKFPKKGDSIKGKILHETKYKYFIQSSEKPGRDFYVTSDVDGYVEYIVEKDIVDVTDNVVKSRASISDKYTIEKLHDIADDFLKSKKITSVNFKIENASMGDNKSFLIEPTPVTDKQNSHLAGMQILYTSNEDEFEVAEIQAGKKQDELWVFGTYKTLPAALTSLLRGNSEKGRKRHPDYDANGIKNSTSKPEPSTGKKRLKDIADYVTRRNIEYVKFKVHGKEYTVASKNIIDGIYIKKSAHSTEVNTQFKLGGGISANHVYVSHRYLTEVVIKKDNKVLEYKGKDVLDGIYVSKDFFGGDIPKMAAPKVTRTQFEEEDYEYGDGGGISSIKSSIEAIIEKYKTDSDYYGSDEEETDAEAVHQTLIEEYDYNIYNPKLVGDTQGMDPQEIWEYTLVKVVPKLKRKATSSKPKKNDSDKVDGAKYMDITERLLNGDKSIPPVEITNIIKTLILAGYTDADLTVDAKSGGAYRNKVDKKTEQVLVKFYKFYDGPLKGNKPFQTIYNIIDMNSRMKYNVLSSMKSVNEFGGGGYVRPSATMKTTGIYKFVTKDKEYILEVSMFERENELKDSLQIQNALRGELGSILINNNAWRRLSKGDTVTAKASKSDVQGKLTRIDDLENVRKHLLSK